MDMNFFELLKILRDLYGSEVQKKINRVDGGHKSLAHRSHLNRANIASKLQSLTKGQVEANRYMKKTESRRSSH